MDFEDSEEIADRMQAQIPGAMTDPASDLPPKAQAVVSGLQAQLKQAQQHAMALELELKGKHGLEKMKQDGETERARMEISARVHDTGIKAKTAIFDTHVKSVTARDVAEIQTAGQLLNTHTEAEHNKEAAAELAKSAEKAEKASV
jgi:preprotein translocase subunit SecD